MASSLQNPPKALVYSSKSALLVVGSTASCSSCTQTRNRSRPGLINSDRDAEKIYQTFVQDAKFLEESHSKLILSSSDSCSRDGVLDAIKEQVSKVQGDDGLFVFVYTGRACDKWDCQVGLEIGEEDSFVTVSPDDSVERFSLVLNQYNCKFSETSLSGNTIGKAIQEGSKPSQVFLILECLHANEISSSLTRALSECDYLEYLIPPGKNHTPCYIHTLNCSAFAFFFNLFVKKTKFVTGMFPIRQVLDKVKKCCKALSCLDMVPDVGFIKANATVPEAKFMRIPERAEREFNEEETGNDTNETDALFEFQSLIDTLKKLFGRKTFVKPCAAAVGWVRDVTQLYIFALKEEGVLEGVVLEAVVGSLVSSLVTIQVQIEGPITSSVFFTQAYMLAIAAVDFVDPGIKELHKNALVASAAEYYMRANEKCSVQDKEAIENAVKELKSNS